MVTALLLALALAATGDAPPPSESAPLDAVVSRSATILSAPDKIVSPKDVAAWQKRGTDVPEAVQNTVKSIAQGAEQIHETSLQQTAASPDIRSQLAKLGQPPEAPEPAFRLFLSLSMPPGELAAAVDLARRDRRVALIFRGAPPGARVNDLLAGMKDALGTVDAEHPVPEIQIDPPRFRDEAVTQVPVLVRYENSKAIARVAGLFDPNWIDQELAAGRHGDLGKHGPTYAITEEDMENRMKAIATGMDWSALRTKAMTNAWKKVPIIDLPASTKETERVLDPTITAQQTLIAPDGRVIARVGDRVNPLENSPFHTRLIIFDATRPEQVELAKKIGEQTKDGDVMYLFTRLAATPSWDALSALSNKMGRPVYRFTEAIQARFGVRSVPTVIEAKDNTFRIYERPALPAKKPS